MNERIRELLVKAGVINNNFNPLAYEQWYLDSLEKFAQLIVRECAGVCAGIAAVRAGYNDVDGRDTAYSCGDTIKEYFGVE